MRLAIVRTTQTHNGGRISVITGTTPALASNLAR
jgi:hypothetical protein